MVAWNCKTAEGAALIVARHRGPERARRAAAEREAKAKQAALKAEKEADARREAETKARLAEVEQLKQQVMQLQQENQTGKIASNLMSQFIESGLVQHEEGNEFTVHASGSPSKFKPVLDE